MDSDSQNYDTSQFSPDGRTTQVEYAEKAADNSGTAIGIRGSDGIVFAVENIEKALRCSESNKNNYIFSIDNHIGAAVAGLMADARRIVNVAREKASSFRMEYGSPAPLSCITQHVGAYMQKNTQSSTRRPFGASLIIGSYDRDDHHLYRLEPSGDAVGCFGCAIGKAKEAAESEMEKINFKEMPIVELVKEAARIIDTVHDSEGDYVLELSWIGEITNGTHITVPSDVYEDAENYVKNV